MPLFSRLLPSLTSTYALQTGRHSRTLHLSSNTDNIIALALAFVPQANDKYHDLGGALGFLSTTVISLYYPSLKTKFWAGSRAPLPALSTFAPRQLLISAALGIWCVRLGTHLTAVCICFLLYATM